MEIASSAPTSGGEHALHGGRIELSSSPASSNRNRSFLPSVVTVLGGQAGCAVLSVLVELCYARLLGPGPRGQISICLAAIAFGVLIGGLGADVPIVVWTARLKKKPSEWLASVAAWGILGCSGACLLWAFFYRQWHATFFRGISPLLAVFVAATIPASVGFIFLTSILTGLERFGLRARLYLVEQAAGLLFIFALVIAFGRSAENAMLGNLLGLIAGAGIAAVFLRDQLAGNWKFRFMERHVRDGLAIGLRGQFGNMATFFSYRLDVFMVNYFQDSVQVGLYALGVLASESLWQVPQAVQSALFPRTARTLDEGATEFTCLVVRQILVIAVVSAALLALASPILIPLIFGDRFQPSVAVVWWILPGTAALSLGKVGCADLAARGKTGYCATFAFVALAVTIVLDFVLIPRMGIRGAALASSAAYFTDAALILAALRRELKVSWRMLLVPSTADFVSYRQAWTLCRQWLPWASAASAPRGKLE